MSKTAFITLRGLLVFCAVVEVGTGIALMIAPEIVAAMLVRGQINELATLLGRCMGIALLALGLACWPQRQAAPPGSAAFRAMFTYSTLIALFLGYVGAVSHLGGPLLWPAVGLHGAMALLLVWTQREKLPNT
jgi:CDP-diglyceride synthetase